MSEQFLRLPVAMAQALLAAEHTYPGISARVLGAWLRLMHLPDSASHSAGLTDGEVGLLTDFGVMVGGRFSAIDSHQKRLNLRRAQGQRGGRAKAKQTASKRLANASKQLPNARANAKQTASKRLPETETETETDILLSSVGSFGADAPTEPPSLALVPENPVAPEPNKFPSWSQAIEALCEAFRVERGAKFVPDGKAMKDLKKLEALAKGDADEVLRRWRIALRSTHPTVGEWGQLLTRWNLFASEGPGARKTPSGVNLFTGDDPNAERDFFGGGR